MEEHTTTTMINENDNAGKGMGIAIFILIIVGFVSAFFIPYLNSACYIAALVLASVLRCGCCCAKQYNLKPHVKKMATATLITLSLLFFVTVISLVMAYVMFFSELDISVFYNVIWAISIIMYILIGLALIFSGIFTWGRKCGAPSV